MSRSFDQSTLATAVKNVHASFSLSTPGISETLRRVRGWAHATSDQSAVSEVFLGFLGILVATDQALATGITALPGPFTDQNDDVWLFWMCLAGEEVFKDATGTLQVPPFQQLIDNKAMRRVEEGQSIVVMTENAQSAGIIIRSALSLYATRN